jgi:hypothetical protein
VDLGGIAAGQVRAAAVAGADHVPGLAGGVEMPDGGARGAAHPSGRATGSAGTVVRLRGVARRAVSLLLLAAGFAMRAGARCLL